MATTLSPDQIKTANKIAAIRYGCGLIGNLVGVGYAFAEKKGFWAYVGYGLLGGIVVGGLGYLATLPAESSLTSEIEDENQVNNK